jgi:hypothetical protein
MAKIRERIARTVADLPLHDETSMTKDVAELGGGSVPAKFPGNYSVQCDTKYDFLCLFYI